MTGDGENQPVESVDALSELANALDPADAQEEEAPEAEEPDDEGQEESEEDEPEEEEEEEAEEPTFTIKHDGKEVTLKQSELIELGQKGFDYSAKTMAVAEERKQVEAVKAQVREKATQHDKALELAEQRLRAVADFAQTLVGSPPSIDLAHQNAAQYLALKEAHEASKGQLQQALTAIQSVEEERARLRQASQAFRAEETWSALRDTLPGWKEDADAKFDGLLKYVSAQGINPDTAGDAFFDKGLWELAHKAQEYDRIQSKKAEMKPKEKLAKVAKPSAHNQSARTTERAKREANFHKNPSVDALADLLR